MSCQRVPCLCPAAITIATGKERDSPPALRKNVRNATPAYTKRHENDLT